MLHTRYISGNRPTTSTLHGILHVYVPVPCANIKDRYTLPVTRTVFTGRKCPKLRPFSRAVDTDTARERG